MEPTHLHEIECGTNNTLVKIGSCVLLPRKFIGTVKWIGMLGEKGSGTFLGIKLSEGSGDSDGIFNGKRYFSAINNKGIFVPKDEVRQVISGEELLTRLVESHRKVKAQVAAIAELKEKIEQTPERALQAQAAMASMSNVSVQINDDSNEAILRYLNSELQKGWYTPLHDVQSRFHEREPQDVAKLWAPKRDDFVNLDVAEPHSRIVYTVATSPRDNLIASGSDDRTVRLWRIENPSSEQPQLRCIKILNLRSCINSLAFSPDGSMLGAALDSGWIELFDMNTGLNTGSLEGQTTSEVWTICFSPDGQQIISGALDRAVRIWDVKERECKWALRGHDEWVNGVAVSPNGRKIISAGGDKTVRVWDTNTMSCSSVLRGHQDFVRSVCVLEDNDTIVSASDDNTLRTWSAESGSGITELQGHSKGIYSVSAGKGTFVASASRDQTVKLWDLSKQNPLVHSYSSHGGDVNSCAFVDNARFIVSGSDDKTVAVYPALYN